MPQQAQNLILILSLSLSLIPQEQGSCGQLHAGDRER